MSFLQGVFQSRQPQGQQGPQPQGVGQTGQGNAQQGPQAGAQAIPQGQQLNPANNGNGSSGPAQGQMNSPQNSNYSQGANPSNPMDPFLKLLTPSQDVLKQHQNQQATQQAGIFGNLDQNAIADQVKKTNFASSVNPELAQKALSGDAQSLMDMMNQVAQNAFQASIQMSQGMVEHGVKTGQERVSGTLDSRIRDFQLNTHNSQNPALQHPVGKSLLKTMSKQIATANPSMSPQEVNQQAESFFMEFAKMITQPEQNKQQAESMKAAGPDWSQWGLDE